MSMPRPVSLAVATPSDALARCQGFSSSADKAEELAESRRYHEAQRDIALCCADPANPVSDSQREAHRNRADSAQRSLDWLDRVERDEPIGPSTRWGGPIRLVAPLVGDDW